MVQPSAAVYVQMIKACGMVSAFSRGGVGVGEVREVQNKGVLIRNMRAATCIVVDS